MKPFPLQFAETPTLEDIDLSMIEYSTSLHMNVIKGTDRPAVLDEMLVTETMTKADYEASDPDPSGGNIALAALMITETHTFNTIEQSDSDR